MYTPDQIAKVLNQEICPLCDGELDTGWECGDCNFDALPIVQEYQPDSFDMN